MASRLGMNRRKAAAQERLDESLPKLADMLKLELPPYPVIRSSPEREAAERVEWTADAVDAVIASIAERAAVDAKSVVAATKAKTAKGGDA